MNTPVYVVLDTNVIVSAMLKCQSVPGGIVEYCVGGQLIPVLDESILQEYREVLSRSKFHLTEQIIDDFLAGFTERGVFTGRSTLDLEFADESDRKFFEVTVEHRKMTETFLVTGNLRHFPSEPFVVSPRAMLDLIQKD